MELGAVAPVIHVVHEAAYQQDAAAVLAEIGAGIGVIGLGGIEAAAGVLHNDLDTRRIDGDRAAYRLGGIVMAAVKDGVGERLLQREQDVELLVPRQPVRRQEVHQVVTRRVQVLGGSGKRHFAPAELVRGGNGVSHALMACCCASLRSSSDSGAMSSTEFSLVSASRRRTRDVGLASTSCPALSTARRCSSTSRPSPAASIPSTASMSTTIRRSGRAIAMQRSVSASTPSTRRPAHTRVTARGALYISIVNISCNPYPGIRVNAGLCFAEASFSGIVFRTSI